MTDLAFAETPSTVLDTDSPTNAVGGGTPKLDAEPSLRDIIANEVKEDAKAPKPEADGEAKPKDEPAKDEKSQKPRAEDGKFAKPEAKEEAPAKVDAPKPDAEDTPKPVAEGDKPTEAKADEPKHEGRKINPPARFLPDAKEHWRNTPRSVQRDIDATLREHEAEVTRYRQAGEKYESVRHFDELAEKSGTTLQAALQNYVSMEQTLRSDPATGFRTLLTNMGIQPQQAVAHILGAFGVSPQQLAQHIANDPGSYVSRAPQPQQQQAPQPDPEVAQLKQQLAALQEQQVVSSVISPFREAHPRFDELIPYIEHFLQSDIVSHSLSAPERLEAAYAMAERLAPSPSGPEDTGGGLEPARRADDDFSGSKSIKSAPGAVSPDMEPERGGSIRDLLQDELKRQKRA